MARSRRTATGLITARRHPAGHLEAQPARGSGRRSAVLASFLQSDIQGDLDAARALLAEIGVVERGQAPQPAAIGNAYRVELSPEGVMLSNAVTKGSRPEQYSFDELRQALGVWIAAIERVRRNPA